MFRWMSCSATIRRFSERMKLDASSFFLFHFTGFVRHFLMISRMSLKSIIHMVDKETIFK